MAKKTKKDEITREEFEEMIDKGDKEIAKRKATKIASDSLW